MSGEKPMRKLREKRGAGSHELVGGGRLLHSLWLLASGCWLFLTPVSCASRDDKAPTTRPSSMRERQDAAMRDPFNYKPDMSRDVSGGDTGHLDREGLKKDLNNVFNP